MYILESNKLDAFLQNIQAKNYQIVGPTINDSAIIYDRINSIADLPQGWQDVQGKGKYSLIKRSDQAYFSYNVGPQAWKKYLFPAQQQLYKTDCQSPVKLTPIAAKRKPYAFLGMRSCELHAIAIQDKVFITDLHVDQTYQLRREETLLIAVNCSVVGNTCFCESMNTGPEVVAGYDLLLTEVIENSHYFIVEVGSKRGEACLQGLILGQAEAQHLAQKEAVINKTKQVMGRKLDTTGIKELLYANAESEIWEEIANRCLSCANCTLACPTCFCNTTVPESSLDHTVTQTRHWDSCFNVDFSYISSGPKRTTVKSRYRHWITHKLAAWYDQFGTSGCVGCGRCITWCPTGIDITEEIAKLQKKNK